MMARKTLVAVAVAALPACAEPTSSPRDALNLDRPVDVSFACYGGLRITDGQPADPSQPVIASAMPTTACAIRSLPRDELDPNANVPPGQEPFGLGADPQGIQGYAFVVQSVPGTVGIARFPNKPSVDYEGGEVVVIDADALTPGKNGITVGSLPVAIATDEAGCHVATANAGSCDLTMLDVSSVLSFSPAPIVNRVAVTDGAGATVLARPAAMIAEPADASNLIGAACPPAPTGLFYVAFPGCHIVAAIDGTGRIVQHVRFDAFGTATVIDDGNVGCPAECGDARMPPTAGSRPVTLDLMIDPRVGTRKLAIGAEDLARVTVVELDANNRFTATVEQIGLDGQVGVLDVAISPQIGMGGRSGERDDAIAVGGQFQFVYAVTTDGTVRVAEIHNQDRECDTQIDPRFLRDIINVGTVSCLPIGDPSRPRRAGARGPGIQLLGDTVPTGVAIFGADLPVNAEGVTPGAGPFNLVGYFAAITSSNGGVFLANIDDDHADDLENLGAPIAVTLPLAIAHQLRDAIPERSQLAITSVGATTVPLCATNGPAYDNPETDAGGPRLAQEPELKVNAAFVGLSKGFTLPRLRALYCEGDDDTRPVSELSFAAPADAREAAYPDLVALRKDETWSLVWEGSLSRDSDASDIDGPSVRHGLVTVGGTGMRVSDPTHPYCWLGVEPHDVVALRGCDPSLGDAHCPVGNSCYVHPDSQVSSGSCIAAEAVDSLATPCRGFLLSARRYSVASATSGELRLVERPRVLRTSPLTGCVSAAQCEMLASVEAALASDEHPGLEPPPPTGRTWACRPDPSRNGAQDRCVLTCDPAGDGSDCDAGTVCNTTGVCVEGIVPPLQCVEAVQRYELRASDAFTVVGTIHGYQHSIIEDMSTGACIPDPAANPLMIGRIPLTAPPCTGDAIPDVSPNPCQVSVDHTYLKNTYLPGTCEFADPDTTLVTELVTAVRFQNPQMRFHLVTPTYPGDLACKGDRMGGLVDVPTVFPGGTIEIHQVDGLLPRTIPVNATFPTRVVRGPQNSLWIVDEGDFLSASSASTRGKVFRVEAVDVTVSNTLQ